jgi:hypothetical protein
MPEIKQTCGNCARLSHEGLGNQTVGNCLLAGYVIFDLNSKCHFYPSEWRERK